MVMALAVGVVLLAVGIVSFRRADRLVELWYELRGFDVNDSIAVGTAVRVICGIVAVAGVASIALALWSA